MPTKTIDGALFLSMLRGGASELGAKRSAINDLNVFPIPDGDTGDNMLMTLQSGLDNASGGSLGDAASALSQGMLLGARGNSGVILSRVFAGIARGLEGLSEAGLEQLAAAMQKGVEESYKAVGTPVEGTMLTVFREGVEKASPDAADSVDEWMDALVKEMEASLERTPELLPVLKEAGVVDSGGAGMLCIARGMREALAGKSAELSSGTVEKAPKRINPDDFGPDDELLYGYCTEFLLRLQTSKNGNLDAFDDGVIKQYLEGAGDSLVYFRDGSIVKVHVHTFRPGEVLSKVQQWGEFLTIKIENMTLQHSEVEIRDNFSPAAPESVPEDSLLSRRERYAVVAVASGEGLCNAFREAGADCIVEGGQTMNPSAADFIEAFKTLNAENIIVFPNNSNIILTARQAAGMYSGAKVMVIPTRDPGEGYVAAASLDRSCTDVSELEKVLLETIGGVATGMVSEAVRDASQDGLEVCKGQFLGFSHKKMLAASDSRSEAALLTARSLGAGGHEVIIVFYGSSVPEAEASEFRASLESEYPGSEIMLTHGGQPVYEYIIVLC